EGHIPDAYSLPLFSNEERSEIGTTYKQEGREEAILRGFDLTGNKWRGFIEEALQIAPGKEACLHCARGGMRSSAMAWALDFYGFDISVIEGGYKRFRNWALDQFGKPYNLCVLGGMTGSHKTEILWELERMGKQVVDLEGLARHQGSAFGSMNKSLQPTQQGFSNKLAMQLAEFGTEQAIWIEDESHTVGDCVVPHALWKRMRKSALIELQVDKKQRIDFLEQEYGPLDKDFLISATERIGKRLGSERTKQAIRAIKEDRMRDFISNVLIYYDKMYSRSTAKRNPEKVFNIEIDYENATKTANQVLTFLEEIYGLHR